MERGEGTGLARKCAEGAASMKRLTSVPVRTRSTLPAELEH
jgi:hypothetical protein